MLATAYGSCRRKRNWYWVEFQRVCINLRVKRNVHVCVYFSSRHQKEGKQKQGVTAGNHSETKYSRGRNKWGPVRMRSTLGLSYHDFRRQYTYGHADIFRDVGRSSEEPVFDTYTLDARICSVAVPVKTEP